MKSVRVNAESLFADVLRALIGRESISKAGVKEILTLPLKPHQVRFDTLVFFVCIASSACVSIYLGQDASWDLRNYHYYNGYAFLNNRVTYDIAPAQIQSFHNPLMDLLFYWMMTHLKPIVYGSLIGALQGINIWLIYKVSYTILIDVSHTRRKWLALAAGMTGYYGAANLSEIGTTFYDNVTSVFVLSALQLIVSSTHTIRCHSHNPLQRDAMTSGFLLGCATGLKLPVAIYSVAFTLSLLFMRSPWKAKVTSATLSGLGVCLGILTTMGYWMTVLWKNFESPVFPYYNKIFRSPYYEFTNFFDGRFFPREKYQVLLYPFYFLKDPHLVSEVGFRDIRFALCYILLMLLLLMTLYKRIARRYGGQKTVADLKGPDRTNSISRLLISFFVLSYVIWQYLFSIYRYLTPLELLSPVVIILIIRYVFRFERIVFWVSLGIFAVTIITMSPMNWDRVAWTESYFDVRIPSLENIARAGVIMADNEPLSYIVPSFPENTRFVSVKNNFMNPASETMLQKKVRETLSNCGGDLYLLYTDKSREDYESILRSYDLKMNKQNGTKVFTKLSDDLYLVPVSRMSHWR